MSKITEIVVSSSARINLGDYQHVDYFVSAKVTVDDGDTPAAAAAHGRIVVSNALVNGIGQNFKARGKAVSAAEIAKRYGLVRSQS